MKLSTKGYSGVQILNSAVVFSDSVPKIFWANLAPKLQNALLRTKFGMEYSGLLILNSGISFWNTVPKITFFWQIWPWTLKVLCLKLNLVQRGIWLCWFRDWQLFLGEIVVLKLQSSMKRNQVQWDIQDCKFWIQFFNMLFLISNTSEDHCCLFLKWNFRKCKP